jgi:hypothetical protein
VKIFDTSSILFSIFASFIVDFELFLQIVGAFFGTMQRLWNKGSMKIENKKQIYKVQRVVKPYLSKIRPRRGT